MLLPGQTLTVDFTLRHPTTGVAADADSLPTGKLVRNGTDSSETVTITNKATGIYKAAATVPASWDAGDVVQLRIAATVNSVADNWPIWGETIDDPGTGLGSVSVDHDYGGTDTLRITDDDGAGIDEVVIRAFLTSEYDAGNRSAAYVVASATTDVTGRWANPMQLDPEDYTLLFVKQGVFQTETTEITVA